MRASHVLSFGLFAITSISTLVNGEPLSVTEFQQALAPVSDAINTLNLAIETNQSATAIILQDLQAVNASVANATNVITKAPGLSIPLTKSPQDTVAQIYTGSTTTPFQETASLLYKYEDVLPPPGQGAPYGFAVLNIIANLGKIELSISPAVPLDDLQIAGATTITLVEFLPLAIVFFGRDHGF